MTREEALKEKAYRYVQDVDGDWFQVYSEKNFINIINKIYDELEVLQKSEQNSYAIGYTQGYLACENNKTPKDIRELLKDKQ